MRTFAFILTVALFGLATGAQAQTCTGSSDTIADPVEFQWTWNTGGYWTGTLELGKADFCIGGETLTTRAYGQYVEGATTRFTIPGPTVRMTPGEKYLLTFRNSLPYEGEPTAHNEFGDPNVSNMHTHGFHISGMTPSDDVTRIVNGGECGDYYYEVPADHMGGTLWYHAHHHGSTYLQVAGGAFGMLIIDDSSDGVPAEVDAMQERPLSFAYLDPAAKGTGGDILMDGTLSATWTANGVVGGSFDMPGDEWEHWRVLIADRDSKLRTLSVGPACEVEMLARDGVWRTTAPLNLPTNEITITGASRVDLAVRCNPNTTSTVTVNGNLVANAVAGASAPTVASPYDPNSADGTWSAIRPAYLRDLRGEPVAASETISMGARTINGSKFDGAVPNQIIDAPGVQEWLIKGATNHPFHLHVYHMQMNGACGDFEDGEYYDTIAASGCLVRFDTSPATAFAGRTIYHCHILSHEDQGAMGWADVQVEGAKAAPWGPVDPEKDVRYQCGDTQPPTVNCAAIADRDSCRAEPLCSWSGKNKACEPAA
jgi:FtsP/CotA-like multicopper oxidase with cupredoxin domain